MVLTHSVGALPHSIYVPVMNTQTVTFGEESSKQHKVLHLEHETLLFRHEVLCVPGPHRCFSLTWNSTSV
jgi:hypothetical protein